MTVLIADVTLPQGDARGDARFWKVRSLSTPHGGPSCEGGELAGSRLLDPADSLLNRGRAERIMGEPPPWRRRACRHAGGRPFHRALSRSCRERRSTGVHAARKTGMRPPAGVPRRAPARRELRPLSDAAPSPRRTGLTAKPRTCWNDRVMRYPGLSQGARSKKRVHTRSFRVPPTLRWCPYFQRV